MPEIVTPYAFGSVLEPKLWPTGGVEQQDPYAPNSPWGAVDFDNEESATILTVRVHKRGAGYTLIIDQHQEDLPLVVDFAANRIERSRAADELIEQLRELASEHYGLIEFTDEGDPAAFALGHVILDLQHDSSTAFAVQFDFPGDDDPDVETEEVPTGWSCIARRIEHDATGESHETVFSHEAEGDMTDISRALDLARAWAAEQAAPAADLWPAPAPTVAPMDAPAHQPRM